MNVDQVERHLVATASSLSDFLIYCDRRDGIPFVRISDPRDPSVWADISTPGVGWFRLAVSGGFMLMDFDDEPSDQDVVGSVGEYLDVALAFLENPPSPVGRFFPSLVVEAPSGRRVLTRSLVSDLQVLLGGINWRGRHLR